MAGVARTGKFVDPKYAYDSGSVSGFIPQIWSGKLIEKLYQSTCLAEIANTDYEGEVKGHGDTVVIRTVPNVVIKNYEIGTTLNYERPLSDKVELALNKAKYFAFEVNDVEAYQSDIDLMNAFSDDAGQQMKIAIDSDVLQRLHVDVAPENYGNSAGISKSYNLGFDKAPLVVTKDNVLDAIAFCAGVLDEQGVPETDRWIVLPTWMSVMLKRSELRNASVMGDSQSIYRNGKLGMLDRFTVYVSNNLDRIIDVAAGNRSCTHIPFGHKKALTFASQMTSLETLPNPTDFGKYVRGLNVYGAKVIDKNALGCMYATPG